MCGQIGNQRLRLPGFLVSFHSMAKVFSTPIQKFLKPIEKLEFIKNVS
jgi:hypothetical protein